VVFKIPDMLTHAYPFLELTYTHSVSRHFRDAEPVGVVVLKLPDMVTRGYHFMLTHVFYHFVLFLSIPYL
jgi:hypothetical protein